MMHVVIANGPVVREQDDGNWYSACDEPGCTVYGLGRTLRETYTLMVDHLNRCHRRGVTAMDVG